MAHYTKVHGMPWKKEGSFFWIIITDRPLAEMGDDLYTSPFTVVHPDCGKIEEFSGKRNDTLLDMLHIMNGYDIVGELSLEERADLFRKIRHQKEQEVQVLSQALGF